MARSCSLPPCLPASPPGTAEAPAWASLSLRVGAGPLMTDGVNGAASGEDVVRGVASSLTSSQKGLLSALEGATSWSSLDA